MGGRIKFHRTANFGDHLQVDFESSRRAKPVLLLGHYDTVYPLGTLKQMPCRLEKSRLYGPGVYDMKAGIALMVTAIEAFRASHEEFPRPVTVLLVSDEEVGSDSSRVITEILAKKSAAVFVCEPSYGPKGAVKTARKGIGEYILKVTGKASHAGLDFEKGESAIIELAAQIAQNFQAGRSQARSDAQRWHDSRRHPRKCCSGGSFREHRCADREHESREGDRKEIARI